MRTIIAGSRTARDPYLIDRAIEQAKLIGITPTIVLSGGQKTWDRDLRRYIGADYLGELWAIAKGIPIERYRAQWSIYGKSAGPRRNVDMIENSEALIAIWDGKTRGTSHVIREAIARGRLVHIEYF